VPADEDAEDMEERTRMESLRAIELNLMRTLHDKDYATMVRSRLAAFQDRLPTVLSQKEY
jgi:hypothetical protein